MTVHKDLEEFILEIEYAGYKAWKMESLDSCKKISRKLEFVDDIIERVKKNGFAFTFPYELEIELLEEIE